MLQHFEVSVIDGIGEARADLWVHIVPVEAVELDRRSVDRDVAACCLDDAEAESDCNAINWCGGCW